MSYVTQLAGTVVVGCDDAWKSFYASHLRRPISLKWTLFLRDHFAQPYQLRRLETRTTHKTRQDSISSPRARGEIYYNFSQRHGRKIKFKVFPPPAVVCDGRGENATFYERCCKRRARISPSILICLSGGGISFWRTRSLSLMTRGEAGEMGSSEWVSGWMLIPHHTDLLLMA